MPAVTTLFRMRSDRVTVLLPCHGIEDFPTWLDDEQSDQLLTAWTAVWHPAIIAATGRRPTWTGLDGPLPQPPTVGVVPAAWDDRFTGDESEARWVRRQDSTDAIAQAAAEALGLSTTAAEWETADRCSDDFRAIGLGVLLAELLAHRMRTDADLTGSGFDAAVVAAARAATTGDKVTERAALDEAFACLGTTRARYYPVECWLLDIVLLASSTAEPAIQRELTSPVPAAVVASGETIQRCATAHPAAMTAMREAVARGLLEPCGGRDREVPLDSCLPEQLWASFVAGREAWREHLGRTPVCYAAVTGGSSAILPGLLTGFGYRAALWSLFDGSAIPDAGTSLIRWEQGGCGVIAIAKPPLDVSRHRSVLELPERLGDAMDHDHVALLPMAHYAGGASGWYDLLRRLGSRSDLLGTFVTPTELVDRAGDAATVAGFEPDAFPPTLPGEADRTPLPPGFGAAAVRDIAARAVAATGSLDDLLPPRKPAGAASASSAPPARRRWLPGGLLGRRREDDALVLDNGLVQVRPHPQTGGLLSLRRPVDRANRISQQLAIRTTTAAHPGHWTSPEDRSIYTTMAADQVVRHGGSREGMIESRGRLVDEAGRTAGTFTQRIRLAASLPLAMIDVEVTTSEILAGPLLEAYVACRFAWHENEDMELRRSLHGQAVVTERSRFTAPQFVEFVLAGGPQPAADPVTLLTGGLPWHVRSSPHVLDTVLLNDGRSAVARLGLGVGIGRPWDAGLVVAAGGVPRPGQLLPGHVRLIPEPAGAAADGEITVDLIESVGQGGDVRIEWARPIARAAVVDFEGRPLPDVPITVAGQTTRIGMQRFQWLRLKLEFADADDRVEVEGGER